MEEEIKNLKEQATSKDDQIVAIYSEIETLKTLLSEKAEEIKHVESKVNQISESIAKSKDILKEPDDEIILEAISDASTTSQFLCTLCDHKYSNPINLQQVPSCETSLQHLLATI